MNNLIDEYFKRDLSEVEEQQMADWLASSPEESQRFALGLADMYQKSGLPEPVWPGGRPPFGNSKWWVKPLIPTAMIVLLLGFTGYKMAVRSPLAPQPESVTSGMPAGMEKVSVKKPRLAPQKGQDQIERNQNPMNSPAPKSQTGAPPSPKTDSEAISASNLALPSLETAPANSSAPAPQLQGRVYQQLSVVVEPSQPGLATVRVFDKGNKEIRTLFAGIIPAGQKIFTWDGKTDNGTVAPAGTYFIEVKSGAKAMRKEVKVEGN